MSENAAPLTADEVKSMITEVAGTVEELFAVWAKEGGYLERLPREQLIDLVHAFMAGYVLGLQRLGQS